MAKVAFSKLGLKVNQEVKEITFNEQVIEVKQYLPIENKLELITQVINDSSDENNFSNPVKIDLHTVLGFISFYTNITFTDKQKEDPAKLCDLVLSGGLWARVAAAIPEAEKDSVRSGIDRAIKSIYKYRNSVLGILDTVSSDYSNLNLDANAIQDQLSNPDNMSLLRNVLDKLG